LDNFPDQAREPGRQPFDPAADPRRAYWRGAAVLSCEAFGVPVRPGCLNEVLAPARRTAPGRRPAPDRARRAPAPAPGPPAPPAPAAPAPAPRGGPRLELPPVQGLLDGLGDALGRRPPDPGARPPARDEARSPTGGGRAGDLLDRLLG
jgi:hypothetical protein